MDDEIRVIHEDPFRLLVSLYMSRRSSLFLELHFNLVANSLILRGRSPGADQKTVREGSNASKIEQKHVKSLLALGSLNGTFQEFVFDRQSPPSLEYSFVFSM